MTEPRPAAPRVGLAGSDVAAVALAALTLSASAGFGRVFRGSTWVGPVLASALVGHGLAWLGRRLRLGLAVSLATSAIGLILLLSWTVLGRHTFYGLPDPGTWSAAAHALHQARLALSQSVPPVAVQPGLVLLSGAAFGAVAVLADWAAFRLRASFEAVLPAAAALIVLGVLGTGRESGWWLGAFVLALALFVAVQEGSRLEEADVRFSGGRGQRGYLTVGAVGLAGAVALGSVVLAPRLPGASARALIGLRHQAQSGPSQRTTVSPLVDIRARLLQQTDQPMFTVRSSQPSYWRLTSLDHFDGDIWSSNEPYATVSGRLPPLDAGPTAVRLDQSYQVESLGSIWLPAAFLPSRVSGVGNLSWDARSASLISRASTSDGERYSVQSVQGRFSPFQLRRANASALSGDQLGGFLQLPMGIPANVTDLARRISAGLHSDYDRALALQNYLRQHYAYSVDVPAGHSESAVERFLFVTRRGYCEQFAGSYAVMARLIGLPTRIAVGFTPGLAEPGGNWQVLGLHAHAWPEVLLGEYGWVAFDPTPGRGPPGATSYTGIPAEQAQPEGPPLAVPVTAPAAGSASPPPPPPPHQQQLRTSPPPRHRHVHRTGDWVAWLAWLGGLLALAGTWVVAVPAAHRWRRRAARRAATTSTQRILLAWEEANAHLRAAGCSRRSSETLAEHARRVRRRGGLTEDALASLQALATQAEAAAYGPPGAAGSDQGLALSRAAAVERAVRAADRWAALRRDLDPRTLWPPRGRRVRRLSPSGTAP